MKGLIASIAVLGLVGAVAAIGVGAVDTANVNATVTVQSVSVSVSDGAVAYGIIAAGASKDTTTSGTNDSQTATNNGNVTETLNIRGTDSGAWTLAGTASGATNYAHKFCTVNCDAGPTWTALTTSNQTLSAGVISTGSQVFDLQVTTPPSAANYTEQSVNVVVQATL